MSKRKCKNKLFDKKRLNKAFDQALHDRSRLDPYSDLLELFVASKKRKKILKNVSRVIKNPKRHKPRISYAYFRPKSSLVYRKMVYVPFEELVVRYALFGVIAEQVDPHLSPRCFANRLERGENSKKRLLEEYATTSWPRFCTWQAAAAKRNKVLVRTDISSFYDSISHDKLLERIAHELALPEDHPLLILVKKELDLPVLSYSHRDGTIERNLMHQGIPTGSALEGVIANLYLKEVDEVMDSLEGIEFGRYNDDMRIFGKNRKDVLNALLVLQEQLLSLGLNLGSAKTKIADSEKKINAMRSKLLEVSGEPEEELKEEGKGIQIIDHIDLGFDMLDDSFDPSKKIRSSEDAKNFCRYLSHRKKDGKRTVPYPMRKKKDIAKLVKILMDYPGSGKHASWLLVESMYRAAISPKVKSFARKEFFRLISSDEIDDYTRYRLLHHIVNRDFLVEELKEELNTLIPMLLSRHAYEVNHVAIVLMFVLGYKPRKAEKMLKKYCPGWMSASLSNAMKHYRYSFTLVKKNKKS